MALGYKIGQPVMMQLGSFQFGIATAAYQELRRSAEWRWPTQERFGQAAAMQFTGPGDETIDLPGVIYPEFRGGFGQLQAMRALAATGKPQQLVDGAGGSMGRWVITRVEEGQTVFADAGAPRRVEFTLSLQRFPDDAASIGAAAVKGAAGAIGAAVAAVKAPAAAAGPLAQVQGLAAQVSSAAASVSGTLNKVAGQVQAAVAPFTAVARDALGAVARAGAAMGELQSLANSTLAMVGVSPIEITALNGAQNLASRAAGLLTSVESASALLRNTGANLAQIAGVPVAATKALQSAQSIADQAVALTRQTAAAAATIKGN